MSREPELSVVVPVKNEAGNIAPLIAEIEQALAGRAFEIVYVDDGSTDATAAELAALAAGRPHLRIVRHADSCGQSAAVRSGARHARAPLIATLDGDGQNDPAFLPALMAAMEAAGPGCGLVQGQRVGRKDTGFKRFQSRIANRVRDAILNDGTRDSGCGLKLMRREVYLALPYFDALHRFTPALIRREGFAIAHVDVKDRPRGQGVSKYRFFDRLWVGIVDLAGVRWLLKRRRRVPEAREVTPP
ncbi:MAG: glycosyltransferase [Methylobacteriaceae bacterium]|nr:glycosyltransferase [Methylobacteriaceae bacterium]